MKRLVALLLIFALALTLCSCDSFDGMELWKQVEGIWVVDNGIEFVCFSIEDDKPYFTYGSFFSDYRESGKVTKIEKKGDTDFVFTVEIGGNSYEFRLSTDRLSSGKVRVTPYAGSGDMVLMHYVGKDYNDLDYDRIMMEATGAEGAWQLLAGCWVGVEGGMAYFMQFSFDEMGEPLLIVGAPFSGYVMGGNVMDYVLDYDAKTFSCNIFIPGHEETEFEDAVGDMTLPLTVDFSTISDFYMMASNVPGSGETISFEYIGSTIDDLSFEKWLEMIGE